MTQEISHLWEIKLPNNCSDQNFHKNTGTHYPSWLDFAEDWRSYDKELAYLFRWDWVPPRVDDEDDSPILWRRDPYYRESKLRLFFVFGGRGIFACYTVSVCRADELVIREWLDERYAHLLSNWGRLPEPAR